MVVLRVAEQEGVELQGRGFEKELGRCGVKVVQVSYVGELMATEVVLSGWLVLLVL
jgi:hypothetical protein